MAQQPPFNPAAYRVQAEKEEEGRTKSRGGEFSANPPSTNLPASIKLMSDIPPGSVPVMGESKNLVPATTPRITRDLRTVNKDAVQIEEQDINEAVMGGKPHKPNVIAQDGYQVVTSDEPGNPDHPATN